MYLVTAILQNSQMIRVRIFGATKPHQMSRLAAGEAKARELRQIAAKCFLAGSSCGHLSRDLECRLSKLLAFTRLASF